MADAPAGPASPPHYPVSGWVEAGLYVLAIGVLSLAYVVGHQIGAHPIAFILYAMLVSAVALLAVTGLGPDALRIMLAPQSWLVGIGTIGIEVFYYVLLEHVAPAHGSLLVRLAIPLALVIGLDAVRAPAAAPRRHRRRRGRSSASCRCSFAIDGRAPRRGGAAAIAAALASTLRSFAAEFHPWNRRAKTVTEKLRVTGLVVLVTSLASLALTGGFALSIGAGWLPPTELVPTAAQMLHGPTILLGTLVGGAHPDGDGGAQLLCRRQDHDRELHGRPRLHAGGDAARAGRRQRRRPHPGLRARPRPAAGHGGRHRRRAADPLCGAPALRLARPRLTPWVGCAGCPAAGPGTRSGTRSPRRAGNT